MIAASLIFNQIISSSERTLFIFGVPATARTPRRQAHRRKSEIATSRSQGLSTGIRDRKEPMSRPPRLHKVTSSFRSSRGGRAKGLQPTSRPQIAQLCEKAKVAGQAPGQIASTSRRSTLLPRRRQPPGTRPLPSAVFVFSPQHSLRFADRTGLWVVIFICLLKKPNPALQRPRSSQLTEDARLWRVRCQRWSGFEA